MNCRLRLLLAIVALVCIGKSGQAQATYGPGGLFVHASAFMPRPRQLDLNVSYFTQRLAPNPRSAFVPVSLTYGVSPQFEVGALYLNQPRGNPGGDSGGAFLKYQLMPDTPRQPAFAIAGSLLGGSIRLFSLSAVFSHTFTRADRPLFIGHLGVHYTRRTDLPHVDEHLDGYYGVEIPFSRTVSALVEAHTTFDRRALSAVGLKWSLGRGVNLGIGYVNISSDDPEFFVGVGYPLGGGR